MFSFHPVKHITTGEGGMITTDNPKFTRRMRRFRNHGITTDFRQREKQGSWFYEMTDLGYNYSDHRYPVCIRAVAVKKTAGFSGTQKEAGGMVFG